MCRVGFSRAWLALATRGTVLMAAGTHASLAALPLSVNQVSLEHSRGLCPPLVMVALALQCRDAWLQRCSLSVHCRKHLLISEAWDEASVHGVWCPVNSELTDRLDSGG